jgi:hypothetical protein
VVDNVNREWNRFISDLPRLAKTATLDLYFSDDPSETMRLYTGTAIRAPLIGTTAVLYLQDKMTQMLQRRVGSGETAADIPLSGIGQNLGTIIWNLLTHPFFGALDDTQDSTNPDIDWDSWLAWFSWGVRQAFVLQIRGEGQTIRQILDITADITGSRIWVDANGKFKFAPPYAIGTLHFSREHCTKIDVIPETSMILNYVKSWYNYDVTAGKFPTNSFEHAQSAASQTDYGYLKHENNLRSVWHMSQTSTQSYVIGKINEYKDPLIFVDLKSDLYGLTTEIGNLEFVTERQKNLNNTSFRVDQTTINLRHQANDYSIDILGYIIKH